MPCRFLEILVFLGGCFYAAPCTLASLRWAYVMQENVQKQKKILFRMRAPKFVGPCSAQQSE